MIHFRKNFLSAFPLSVLSVTARVSSISFCQLFQWGAAIAQWFICAYHPATLGSDPKHTIYAFIIYSQICAVFVISKERK